MPAESLPDGLTTTAPAGTGYRADPTGREPAGAPSVVCAPPLGAEAGVVVGAGVGVAVEEVGDAVGVGTLELVGVGVAVGGAGVVVEDGGAAGASADQPSIRCTATAPTSEAPDW